MTEYKLGRALQFEIWHRIEMSISPSFLQYSNQNDRVDQVHRAMISIESISFRLEHVLADNVTSTGVSTDGLSSPSILSSVTPYHKAAELQEVAMDDDTTADQTSLNCEDGSLSSHSTGEHYAMEDIINRSRSNERLLDTDENLRMTTNDDNEREITQDYERMITGALDFSFKMDETNQGLFNSTNRSRSINTSNKSRSLKRKHLNDNTDHEETVPIPNRIFHADAFCTLCRKVRSDNSLQWHIVVIHFSSLGILQQILSQNTVSQLSLHFSLHDLLLLTIDRWILLSICSIWTRFYDERCSEIDGWEILHALLLDDHVSITCKSDQERCTWICHANQ